MSKNKGTDYFYFKPFRSGSVSFPRQNEAIYVIDVLSRDDIVYFDDFGYLISERALEVLKKHNLTGVKVDNATVKFSAKHNIRYKNQTLPKFYRLIPTEIVDNELREMFLDENYNLIINKRIKDIITNKDLMRLQRSYFEEIELEDVLDDYEDEAETPVYKNENKSSLKQIIIFTVVMALVAYLFFK
ncbi:hypothetical protein HWS29_004445 [Salmonella enterica]|nr:hypothetical protein [Salmonella enterica]EFX1497848.1 hypothetical protein [Salmonella enterica]EMD9653683.1 hypothetical protein [Salmonella enterica]